jgi:hypothetical protein
VDTAVSRHSSSVDVLQGDWMMLAFCVVLPFATSAHLFEFNATSVAVDGSAASGSSASDPTSEEGAVQAGAPTMAKVRAAAHATVVVETSDIFKGMSFPVPGHRRLGVPSDRATTVPWRACCPPFGRSDPQQRRRRREFRVIGRANVAQGERRPSLRHARAHIDRNVVSSPTLRDRRLVAR